MNLIVGNLVKPEWMVRSMQTALFIFLYTQSGSEHDIKTISRNVVDYDTLSLEKGKDLADWESGVVNRQIDNISKGICEHTPAQVYSLIATHDMMDMYNLGANMGMYFYV